MPTLDPRFKHVKRRIWAKKKPGKLSVRGIRGSGIATRVSDADLRNASTANVWAQVIIDVPSDRGVDFATCFHDADELLHAAAAVTAPFYDRTWGGRMVVPDSARPT